VFSNSRKLCTSSSADGIAGKDMGDVAFGALGDVLGDEARFSDRGTIEVTP